MDTAGPSFHYRIPPPGIVQRGDSILMNSIYPGMTIKYTIDGSAPDWNAPTYTGPLRGRFPYVRAKIFNAKGRSGLESQISAAQ
jgi:hexosaminidase